jgi:phospholipase/carboxylesterase
MNPESISSIMVKASKAFETAMRKLNPFVLSGIREELLIHLEPLTAARQFLLGADANTMDKNAQTGLLRATDFLIHAIKSFGNEEDLEASFISALRAGRKYCRAQEVLFALCGSFSEINRHFLEAEVNIAPPGDNFQSAQTGIFHIGANHGLHARGGYSLYIPDNYTPERAWPLIVALHGGYSHGKDFIWSWLREARSRGYILFAPTSTAMTWSITDVERDGKIIAGHLEDVYSRVNVDMSRILLTGMSDGGTYALGLALSQGSIYRSVAAVACALPPVDFREARGKRICWIHGAQDWIFPAARMLYSCKELTQAGADIKLKILPDLSHTYPRGENDTILRWFKSANA